MGFNTLKQAEQEEGRRIKKQIWVVFGAAICALREVPKWNFGHWRCHRFVEEANKVLMEQADMNISMPDLCAKETGMIMTRKGKSYKTVYLLNSEEWWRASEPHDGYIGFTDRQKISHIEDVLDWIPQVYEACAMIAMHRVFGWGKNKRLPELLECIEGIRAECRDAQYYMDLLKINYGTEFDLKK